jgi:hypothetical protein
MQRGDMKYKYDTAVVSAIGVVLIIGVITIAMTLITVYYIPVWIEDKEAEHLKKVLSQFKELKTTVDNQILQSNTELTMSSPILLGEEGTTLLQSTTTLGNIELNMFSGKFTVEDGGDGGDNNEVLNVTSWGNLQFTSITRYYIHQDIIYEFGSVVINQSDGQLMSVTPHFSVGIYNNRVIVSLTLITLSGSPETFTGTYTVMIQTQYKYNWTTTYFPSGSILTQDWVYLNITTKCISAWSEWFDEKLTGLESTDYDVTTDADTVYVRINCHVFRLGYALIDTDIGT